MIDKLAIKGQNREKTKIWAWLIALSIISNLLSFNLISAAEPKAFSDVPAEHWAAEYVQELRNRGITDGIGNNQFGMGKSISRYEFVTFLVRLMKWDLVNQPNPTFADATDTGAWYYAPLETAVSKGLLMAVGSEFDKDPGVSKRSFGGDYAITRQEMAIMIVRALGYGQIASKLDLEPSFSDVERFKGYINVAKDLGIINGTGPRTFAPTATATKEEAAAMMIRMARKLDAGINDLHGFYAIRSFGQRQFINGLDSVSFGWSRLGHSAQKGYYLNTSRDKDNDFAIPVGYEQVLAEARAQNVKMHLMVYASDTSKIGEAGNLTVFLENPSEQAKVIKQIVEEISAAKLNLDGVTIDFEEMKGEAKKAQFVSFLNNLKVALNGKRLLVAVHPQRKEGIAYFDGYDFRKIGQIADRVILMAHDYYAKTLTPSEAEQGYTLTPLAPLDKIYNALRFITDKNTGVEDINKVMLQVSFGSVQWQRKNGKVVNQIAFQPTYDKITAALAKSNAEITFQEQYSSPRATYLTEDGTENILWYEDSRSIVAKIQLAKMFGVRNISIWRLGNIPNDKKAPYLNVWEAIQKEK